MTQTRFETFNVPATYMTTQIVLCIHESYTLHRAIFASVAVILHSISRSTSLTEGTLSLLPQKGRFLWISQRNSASLAWITTQSSRLRQLTRRRPNIITGGVKRFRQTDVLFQPSVRPEDSTSPRSRATWNATFTSARMCTSLSCGQAARIRSRRFA